MVNKRFHNSKIELTLQDIIDITGVKVLGNVDLNEKIKDIASLSQATSDDLSFFTNSKYMSEFENSKAKFCFTKEKYIDKAPASMKLLISDNPYKAYALVAAKLYLLVEKNSKISSTAIIHKNAKIGNNCFIGDYVIIEDGVEIGDGTVINHNVVVLANCIIGKDCKIASQVTISHSVIGDRVIIHPGVRLGQDGFGFASDHTGHMKVMQLGGVQIGNDVEIGANTTIDRGAGPDTIIGDMTKIDNLVQIGHNVEIGKGCFIVSQVGIAGSTKIGNFVVLGGQVGVSGHIEIDDFVQVAAKSGVHTDILVKNQTYGGFPIMPIREWHKQNILLKKMVKTNKMEEDK